MPIKRKRLIIIVGLSFIIFFGSTLNGIYAMISVSVTNHLETGIVNIKITEHQIEGGLEKDWENNPIILPGDEISKIPRIHNEGNDCYVRAHISIYNDKNEENDELKKIEFHGMSDKWILANDGYYYYTEVFRTGESVDLFQSVYIPKEFSEQMMEDTFFIDIDVDAIQEQNFIPQFDLEEPWGNIEILKCEKEGIYDISSFKQADTQSFQIVYQGKSKELIVNSKDFFTNIPYIMPGDIYSETIDIINNSENVMRLYFRSEALDDSELLDKIKLKIITEIEEQRQILYDGDLRATNLLDNIVLGVIQKNRAGKIYFEIEIPKELSNQYSILNSYVKWIFSTEPIIDSGILEPNHAGQTGDFNNIQILISIFGIIISIVIMIIVMIVARRTENENKK